MQTPCSCRTVLLAVAVLAVSVGCTPSAPPARPEPTYTEKYRPQYHFTPAVNWMNDPNGLVYFDGEYHLFYQHNPEGIRWGHMSWGHAVSTDLVHWEHLPVALPEADGVMAFSGSAVVDWNNTSGCGDGETPPLVAIYTGHRPAERPEDERQAQHVAYSTDRGRTWTKYAGNPVLDLDLPHFRDPKVFWYEPDGKWVMVVALAADHQVQFYASDDLKDWALLSTFGPAGGNGGFWECPDLFDLPVDGDPTRTRWVPEVDLGDGAYAGGSGGQYFDGHFDGTTFTPGSDTARWVDSGKDFYAAITWADVLPRDRRRLWIGWMNNWQYAQDVPTEPWRSVQSLPRTLALRTVDGAPTLVQRPVEELQRLRRTPVHLEETPLPEGTLPLADRGIAGAALELVATFDAGNAETVGLKVRVGDGEETLIGYDVAAGTEAGFHENFVGRHDGPLALEDGRAQLQVFVDWSSVEVFASQERVVPTDQIFPSPARDGVARFAEGGAARLVSLDAWTLASIRESRVRETAP